MQAALDRKQFSIFKSVMNRKLRSARKLHSPASPASSVLRKLGLDRENPGVFCGEWLGSGDLLKSISPINGQVLAIIGNEDTELKGWHGTFIPARRPVC